MSEFFSIPVTVWARILAGTLVLALVFIAALAWHHRLFVALAWRSIPRRRLQALLIVAGVALSGVLVLLSLATGDTLTYTIRQQVVETLGRTDELLYAGSNDQPFPVALYGNLVAQIGHDRRIAGIVPANHRSNLVVADVTTRQIRDQVDLLGAPATIPAAFGAFKTAAGRAVSTATLGSHDVFVNADLAKDLTATAGDHLYLFLNGQRIELRVRAVVANGGLTGRTRTVIMSLAAAQALLGLPAQLNRILVANAGASAVAAAAASDDVTAVLQNASAALTVDQVKQNAENTVQRAQDIFTRIFTLFILFAAAISLLLICLIFTMLASERRSEMGVMRAMGGQRGHLVQIFLFEGVAYDIVASLLGVAAGIVIGQSVIALLAGVLARFQVPLTFRLTNSSLVIAVCLGCLFTLLVTVASAWGVSRMTIVHAIKGLPEKPRTQGHLRRALRLLRHHLGGSVQAVVRPGRSWIALEYHALGMVSAFIAVLREAFASGLLFLIGAWPLISAGEVQGDMTLFSLGVSILALGMGLGLRWALHGLGRWVPYLAHQADRLGLTIAGLGLVGYWVLPFDTLQLLGLPHFIGGIEEFFLAGLMMVGGAVWLALYNVDIPVRLLTLLMGHMARTALIVRTAVAFPLHHRFRTGITLAMFSLVIFTLTVMTVIGHASQDSYNNPNAMNTGFNLQAQVLFQTIPNIEHQLAHSPYIKRSEFSAIGTQAYTTVGMIQLAASQPHWAPYPASVVTQGFVQGTHIALGTRARGFVSDASVWQALATHPGYAVIDSNAVSSRGGYSSPPLVQGMTGFQLQGVFQEDRQMDPTPVWIIDPRGGHATKVTIIGVIDPRAYNTFGLFISAATLQTMAAPPVAPQTYFFRTTPGRDPEIERRRLESAFFDVGLQASVISDDILRQQGPRMLVSAILEGFVGLTILMGVAALGLIAARSVVERRSQIGMLRAIGYQYWAVAGSLLLESSFITLLGSVIGVALGLALCQNLFSSNFFEQYKTGMIFSVPWQQLILVLVFTYAASLIATALPAWQAARIPPADALRYQ